MNILDKMIESERIYGADEPWAEYREALTDFIIANCREREVQENPENSEDCRKKLVQGEALTNHPDLPTLAIFGVGESWDLDLRRLSEHYRLVRIGRGIEGESSAKDR